LKIDYEAELAFVIGKRAKNAQRKDSLNHIFGYFPANDVSARKLQFMSSQWLLGKTLDAFAPIGPYLVAADEVQDPGCPNVQCRVNGQLRQIAPTSDIIYFISALISLEPGDIVLTGTTDGVAPGRKEDDFWISDGDAVEVSIEKLGTLRNRFVKALQ
jgi:2-keto-4-pentenoate hydratase/2-oxohepta-3-ene-1,7-dioic acid hydratase in catechol pathway